ncbi:FliM/FliN family flagellar motor switch protein [Aquabacterium sp.]|uniref:FliM/FliN family flagellar motor switch protein n=1 Tax=Aquabacterium sp. TaxID=1872578 RepID=UPI002D0AAE97|nr:FliM/FliN family flagellar motor switch protein [Aquabacterium sp.]HSW06369.1 FliM/FliN family flagellar motor switch protein [Aquabacterium sp.]
MTTESTATSSGPAMQPVELTPVKHQPGQVPAASALTMAALAGVRTKLTLVAGHAMSTVGDIMTLKEGGILKLDTELNAPFDIVLNDTVIARGELVAVGDHFGVCVTQIVAPATK